MPFNLPDHTAALIHPIGYLKKEKCSGIKKRFSTTRWPMYLTASSFSFFYGTLFFGGEKEPGSYSDELHCWTVAVKMVENDISYISFYIEKKKCQVSHLWTLPFPREKKRPSLKTFSKIVTQEGERPRIQIGNLDPFPPNGKLPSNSWLWSTLRNITTRSVKTVI